MSIIEFISLPTKRDLVWTGTDKKTTRISNNDYIYQQGNQPFMPYNVEYPTPSRFTIMYLDATLQTRYVPLTYAMNGVTKWTYSYRKDNDVFSISIYKESMEMEINIRNNKLEYPIDFNLLNFKIRIDNSMERNLNIDGLGSVEIGELVSPNTSTKITLIGDDGYVPVMDETEIVYVNRNGETVNQPYTISNSEITFRLPKDDTVNIDIPLEISAYFIENPTPPTPTEDEIRMAYIRFDDTMTAEVEYNVDKGTIKVSKYE